jgi:hypothetical protein
MAVIHLPYGIEGTLDLEIQDKNLVLDTDVSFPEEISGLDQERGGNHGGKWATERDDRIRT